MSDDINDKKKEIDWKENDLLVAMAAVSFHAALANSKNVGTSTEFAEFAYEGAEVFVAETKKRFEFERGDPEFPKRRSDCK